MNTKNKILAGLFSMAALFSSCNDFQEINEDPNQVDIITLRHFYRRKVTSSFRNTWFCCHNITVYNFNCANLLQISEQHLHISEKIVNILP